MIHQRYFLFSLFLFSLLILGPQAVSVRAAVLHWWRFEEDEFLSDSVGGIALDGSLSNSIRQTGLPRIHPTTGMGNGGESFPFSYRQSVPNLSALESRNVSHGLFAGDTDPVSGDYTIEVFAHIDTLSANNVAAILATQNTGLQPSSFSWMLQVRTDGFEGTDRGELAAWNSDGTSYVFLNSGIVLEEQTDYYLAGSFDLAGGNYTFYVQDLTNGTQLQSVEVPHQVNRLQPNPYFLVGGRDGFSLDGLLDEVRFSNEVLSVDDLLINNVTPVDFDDDGLATSADVDLLVEEIVAGGNDLRFDVSGDGVVDTTDATDWLSHASPRNGFSEPYSMGDANLDGTVDSQDLNSLALNWQQNVARWSGGDFTADGIVNSADLNMIGINWQQSISMASSANAPVPEPSALLPLVIGLAFLWRRSR